jgi:hypothetical protein
MEELSLHAGKAAVTQDRSQASLREFHHDIAPGDAPCTRCPASIDLGRKRMMASHKTSYLAAIHLPFILRMRVSSNAMTRHDLLVTTNATSLFAGI